MECVILVDNSNIYIAGKKLSAARKGVTTLTPDGSFRVVAPARPKRLPCRAG